MPYGTGGSMMDVSEGEMRWQIYTSLALGAKGVLYFCYWSPVHDPTFLRGQAIMTPRAVEPGKLPTIDQQVPSQKYPIVQRLNAKLKVLGNFLLKRASSAVVQRNGAATETRQIAHPVLQAINGTNTGATWEFLLGFFDSNSTVLLVNQDSDHPALASLSLAHGAALQEVDGSSGAVAAAVDDSPLLPGFQISLLPGDGRLFLLGSVDP